MSIDARFRVERTGFTLDADLQIPSRGVTALFGPSGSGKTTLLRAMAGLDRHSAGFLRIGETVWQDDGTFVPPHQRSLGYVFQEPGLFAHLNVRDNIGYGLKRAAKSGREQLSLERVVELLEIGELLDRKPHTLSGGERQRVAIARALAAGPRLLLMDEPLASLDQTRRNEILPRLESLHRELMIPVIYVSHSTDEVARLADHLVLIENGRVNAAGPVGELLTRLDLSPAHDVGASAVIEAAVAGHDDEFRLTHLDSPAGRFVLIGNMLPAGRAVRLRIAARDVSLTLVRQFGSSILNIFPATVDEMAPDGEAQMMVRLRVGDVPVLSRITRKSAAELDLKPGKPVFAQIKSVALLG